MVYRDSLLYTANALLLLTDGGLQTEHSNVHVEYGFEQAIYKSQQFFSPVKEITRKQPIIMCCAHFVERFYEINKFKFMNKN